MKRFRPTDAFVDESIRGQRYVLACVLVEARQLTTVRREVAELVVGGKRLHFHPELDSTRKNALERFAVMPIRVSVVVCVRGHGVTEFIARDACLAELVHQLQARTVPKLTIESRQDDRDDARTIARQRRREPLLVFDDLPGDREPMLWIADAVAWAFRAPATGSCSVMTTRRPSGRG